MDVQEYAIKLARATILNFKWIEETEDPEIASTCLDAIEEMANQVLEMIPDKTLADTRTVRQKIRDGGAPHIKEKLEEMGVL